MYGPTLIGTKISVLFIEVFFLFVFLIWRVYNERFHCICCLANRYLSIRGYSYKSYTVLLVVTD